jgi:hypothetical protein
MSKVLELTELEVDLVSDDVIHYIVVALVDNMKPGRSDVCYPADIAEPGYMLPGVCSATFEVSKDDIQPDIKTIDQNLSYINALDLPWMLDHEEF